MNHHNQISHSEAVTPHEDIIRESGICGADAMESDSEGGSERAEEDSVKPKGIKVEYQPSNEEMDEHMLTHIPFKSWCQHCEKKERLKASHISG